MASKQKYKCTCSCSGKRHKCRAAQSSSTEYGRLCPQCMSDDLRIWDGHTGPKCSGNMRQEGKEEFWT